MAELSHPSAMVAEVLEYLRPRPGGVYIDATIDGGGHAEAILEASAPDGFLIGLDMDRSALDLARRRLARFEGRFQLLWMRFSRIEQALVEVGVPLVDGVLADLGPSRIQLLDPARGMSFDSDAKLDCRFDRSQSLTAWEIVNRWPRKKLFQVLARTGKRRLAGIIADAIVEERQKGAIDTPRELAQLIARVLGREKRGHVHVSTEWLAALRWAVNREFEEAEAGIEAAARIIRPGGRLVVLSWDGTMHRLVKETMRRLQRGCVCPPELPCVCGREPMLKILTPGGLAPGEAERKVNPAARTCRLFAAEILAHKYNRIGPAAV